MKTFIKKHIRVLVALALIFWGIQMPAAAKAQDDKGITVYSTDEFMNALKLQKSPITVGTLITISDGAEESGRMLPVKIPAGTVIQGGEGGQLNSRSPIQLEGDGVCFKNIKLTFSSTNALGSVPHREIFLAGHSLTMDNVDTYLEGGNNSFGDLSGTEEELLPTIYAGGFTGSSVGSNASLTVKNSNDNTLFKAIYMGHEAGSDNSVPYKADAVLNLDTRLTVREEIHTSLNRRAEINFTGEEGKYARANKFQGNQDTTLTLNKVSMDKAVVNDVGHIVLKDRACLFSATEVLYDVTVQNGACLDLNSVANAEIFGDFTGEENPAQERGFLVLNEEGSLIIDGEVTGTTQFQTYHKLYAGTLFVDKTYILAKPKAGTESGFVLAQTKIDQGYGLKYSEGSWIVTYEEEGSFQIGDIKILSAPEKVDIRKKVQTEAGTILDESAYFDIKWYDGNGNEYSNNDVEENMFYDMEYVFAIRTDYWESSADNVAGKTDWSQPVLLVASKDHPGRYYLQPYGEIKQGDYTFLFCSEYCENELRTVADVKALTNTVVIQKDVNFYNQDTEEPGETEKPEKPGEPDNPGHIHVYQAAVTKEATCTKEGLRTYTCNCGARYTEKIAVAPHRYTQKRTPATINNNGKVQQVCSVCSAAKTISVINRPQITWSRTDFSYDGKAKSPSVTIRDTAGKTLTAGADYQVVYSQGQKNPGIYTVTVEFCGSYSGKAAGTYTIRPKKTSLKKTSAKSKGMQVKWKKQTAQTDGYQIQYSTSKNFTGKTTKLTTAKKSADSKKISRLKGKKKYYVRIRTYKTVNVNGGKVKLYSDWSGKKSVKTKK